MIPCKKSLFSKIGIESNELIEKFIRELKEANNGDEESISFYHKEITEFQEKIIKKQKNILKRNDALKQLKLLIPGDKANDISARTPVES